MYRTMIDKLKKVKSIKLIFTKLDQFYYIYIYGTYYELTKINKKVPNVENFDNTVKYIIENNCSVSRFGDGELNIIFYNYGVGFQDYNKDLAVRLLEIMNSKNENHIVCIPNIFDGGLYKCVNNTRYFWYKYIFNNYKRFIKYINNDNTYYDSFITRPYIRYKDKSTAKDKFNKLKMIWNNKDLLIIEGIESRLGVGNDLFNNSKSIKRILCPSKNAFSRYTEIFKVSKEFAKDRLILIALGPTATVLAYDLFLEGYQAIDIGHIDIEYEWFLLGVEEKINLKNKYVNEKIINDNSIEDIDDEIYNLQIIYKID